ncbi:MAG: hypothetical protein EU541_05595 [Promethearchaeota archaeon]|nr:MAG: hypothetical protein EU541_05595 [Candidatus Lokiarchaeota archaeon]
MADIQTQLEEHLKNGKNWEKMKTPVPGVGITKVPGTKSRPPMLFLAINPVNEDGSPMKRKDLFVKNKRELVKFSELLTDDKVLQLINELEAVNPSKKKKEAKKLKM